MPVHNRTAEEDITDFSTLLDAILAEQTSNDVHKTVEQLREAANAYRQGDTDSRDSLRTQLARLNPDTEGNIARAFSTYFELINLAEERERIRKIRTMEHEGTLDDGLEDAFDELREYPDEAASVLNDVEVIPTFTAHPTEARRKTVKNKLWSIAEHLEILDEHHLTTKEEHAIRRALEAEIISLWQTPQIRDQRPEPKDEARNVQWYLENTIYDVVGKVYDSLENAVRTDLPGDVSLPPVLSFRSWAGSDRDGNPFVTPDTTATTLNSQRQAILSKYIDHLTELSGMLSQDGRRINTGRAFDHSIESDRELLPGVVDSAQDRYPNEPYRKKLRIMQERLTRVDDVRPGGYEHPDEFKADLDLIAESLRENNAEKVAETFVDPLRWQVETFGFVFAALDLRDHRERHTTAVTEALEKVEIEYESLTEAERVDLLTEMIQQDEPVIDLSDHDGLSDTASEVLELFDSLVEWQTEYRSSAIDAYCISMTEEVSHILEVLFLADQADVVVLPDYAGLDIVPLFESQEAFTRLGTIMETLFENPVYSQVIEARDSTQEVMIGYSDSNKENGFLAANWELYRNQRRLASIAEEYGITVRLFHGRGDSISRGGGPMSEALLALPRDTVTGPVKFTEQGEAISEKYANPRIAERELEQMLSAQLRARLRARTRSDSPVEEEWIDAMGSMATAARSAYRELLESEGFVEYFEDATPITVIERLNLGSRPSFRSGKKSVEELRTIPWVFAWTQSRCILPGWYSVASGIDAFLENDGELAVLQEMYENWPFFRSVLDNATQALAKTEMEIAAEYAELADPVCREEIFPQLQHEYERAVTLIKEITGRDKLLKRAWFEETLRRRNPYVDPLNLLQVKLLGQTHRTEAEERTLRLTVKGIAAGMKNTG